MNTYTHDKKEYILEDKDFLLISALDRLSNEIMKLRVSQ